MIGKNFGRLKVLKISHPNKRVTWLCLCDCGNKVIVRGDGLKSGNTKSCGCYQREIATKTCKRIRTIHGKSHTKVWNVYKSIIARCYNEKNKSYKNYGARGIKCQWDSFKAFYKDMGDVPEGGYSIERIDNNKGYYKKNCRWATASEQANNRRTARLITYEGKTLNMKTWAKIQKINYHTLFNRISRGWPIEKALTLKSGEKI